MTKVQSDFLYSLEVWIYNNNYSNYEVSIKLSKQCKVSESQIKKMRNKEIIPTEKTINKWDKIINNFDSDSNYSSFNDMFGGIFKDIFN